MNQLRQPTRSGNVAKRSIHQLMKLRGTSTTESLMRPPGVSGRVPDTQPTAISRAHRYGSARSHLRTVPERAERSNPHTVC